LPGIQVPYFSREIEDIEEQECMKGFASSASQPRQGCDTSSVTRISRIEAVKPILSVVRRPQAKTSANEGPSFADELTKAIEKLNLPKQI